MSSTKLFPVLMILLSVCAAIRYGVAGDVRHCVYWTASAVLISSVTF